MKKSAAVAAMPKRKKVIVEVAAPPKKRHCGLATLNGMTMGTENLPTTGEQTSALLMLPRELIFCIVAYALHRNPRMVCTLRACCKRLRAAVDVTVCMDESIPLLIAAHNNCGESVHYLWQHTNPGCVDLTQLMCVATRAFLQNIDSIRALVGHVPESAWAACVFNERRARGDERDYCTLLSEGLFDGTPMISEAFCLACAKNWHQLFELALALGADPTHQNQRPLRSVCRFADTVLLEKLLALPGVNPRVNRYSPFALVGNRRLGTDITMLLCLLRRLPHCKVKPLRNVMLSLAQKYETLGLLPVLVKELLSDSCVDPFSSGLWDAVTSISTTMSALFLQHRRVQTPVE